MKRILLALLFVSMAAQAQDLKEIELLMEHKQYKAALEGAGKMAAQAEKNGDFTEMIKAKSLMVEACLETGDQDKAAEYFESAISNFTRKQLYSLSYYGNAQALSQISLIYKECGDIDEARIYARNALDYMNAAEPGNIMLIRYSRLADLDMAAGNYEMALESLETAFSHLNDGVSVKVRTDLMMQMVLCLEGLGKGAIADVIMDEIERIIHTAAYDPAINSSSIYLRLAERSLKKADTTAFFTYSDCALQSAKLANDRIKEAETYRFLAEHNTIPEETARFRKMADSLSYEPYLRRMVGKMSFSSLEFARRERDQKIKIQRLRITLLISAIAIMAAILLLMALLLRNRCHRSELQKEQIESLRKSLAQKEHLLKIANAVVDPEMKKELASAAEGIDLSVRLTPREAEIARLAANGQSNKEIADSLSISTRTVESHRNNIYRKLGISNLSELRYYMMMFSKDC